MSVPPSHYALVGPLWTDLEEALHDAGAVGPTAKSQIDSLRSRLGASSTRRLHDVREERNRLTHKWPRPLRNPPRWERDCRAAISDLRALSGSRRAMPTPHRARPHFRRYPVHHHSHPVTRHRRGRWPFWARASACGIGGYLIFSNETLTVMAAFSLIGLVVWSIVRPR